MIFSKIKKHFSLFAIRLVEKRTIQKMLAENDQYLNDIVSSFVQLKSGQHTSEDIVVFNRCEAYRKSLLNNHTLISYEIFGQNKSMKVNEICSQATSKSIWAQLLYLVTKKNKSPYFLEIGTNLGVSGSYILEALKAKIHSSFITMEGVPQLCQISNNQFSKISSSEKYTIIEGLYEKTFAELLTTNVNFNILFIDGNHRKESTIEYFNNLKSNLKFPAVFIFDDINWSNDMKQAWKIIKSDLDVSYSIDMFKLGIVIFNKKINKSKAKHYYLHLSY
ncbi:MAG: hypothetical protein CMP56_00450 [Flavobacteriales bacterium]|nr:hypothetical protein [Flavobacteriales bacterium]